MAFKTLLLVSFLGLPLPLKMVLLNSEDEGVRTVQESFVFHAC